MSALSDLLKQHQGERSVREIGRACGKYGVGESTVTPYFNGKHGLNPPEEVLYALSMVMPLDIGDLRAAAGVPRGESDPYVPPLEANRLTHRQRNALDELIRSFTSEGVGYDMETATQSDASASGNEEKEAELFDDAESGDGLDSAAARVIGDLGEFQVENRDKGRKKA